MARVGSFSGPSVSFGLPGNVLHPADNVFPAPLTDPDEIYKGLTDKQREDLQRQIDALRAMLGLGPGPLIPMVDPASTQIRQEFDDGAYFIGSRVRY